jgi:hypothetical protein
MAVFLIVALEMIAALTKQTAVAWGRGERKGE